jgi:hypothetical protein
LNDGERWRMRYQLSNKESNYFYRVKCFNMSHKLSGPSSIQIRPVPGWMSDNWLWIHDIDWNDNWWHEWGHQDWFPEVSYRRHAYTGPWDLKLALTIGDELSLIHDSVLNDSCVFTGSQETFWSMPHYAPEKKTDDGLGSPLLIKPASCWTIAWMIIFKREWPIGHMPRYQRYYFMVMVLDSTLMGIASIERKAIPLDLTWHECHQLWHDPWPVNDHQVRDVDREERHENVKMAVRDENYSISLRDAARTVRVMITE